MTVDGKYGDRTHTALMDAVADHDAGKEPAEPDEPSEPSIARRVRIVCDGGTVNIRIRQSLTMRCMKKCRY